MSFLIAGGGAVFLSFIFLLYLTKPIMRLRAAAEEIASGNFDVRVDINSRDEIGELADSFNYMSEALKKEDEIRRHLTSNIAHELRTPLTIMNATLEGIIDEVMACTKDQAKDIKEEVERLIRLVEGIEDMTRAEASFLSPSVPERINLSDELQKQVAVFRHASDEKGISIEFRNTGDIFIMTDQGKLDTIIRNLLANAIKFTDRGKVILEYGMSDDRYFVSVQDSGSGLGDEEKGKIFNRFYKGAASNGTGLGLAIVHELVGAMKGKVQVESSPGAGSTFTVSFPTHLDKE